MLTLHYVNPTGLFSYAVSGNTEFKEGSLVNLVGVNLDTGGGSNGAGKSSIFNATCELLFGDNPTDVSGPSVVNNVWDRGCCGRVEFTSWEKVRYRVTLCRDWKDSSYFTADNDSGIAYNGTSLFFDKYEGGIWKDFRGSGMPDTRKRILEKVGISYTRFLSIAYMSHRVGNKFLRGTNKDRVDILSGVIGVEEWDVVLGKCRKKKSEFDSEVRAIQEKASYEQGVLHQLNLRVDELAKTDWEGSIKAQEDSLKTLKATELTLTDILQKFDSERVLLTESLGVIDDTISARITANKVEISKLESSFIPVPPNLKSETDLSHIEKEIEFAQRQASSLGQGAGALLTLEKCPTCDSKITKTKKVAIEKKLAGLSKQVAKLRVEELRVLDLIAKEKDVSISLDKEKRKEIQVQVTELESECNKLVADYNKQLESRKGVQRKLDVLDRDRLSSERELSFTQYSIENVPAQIAVYRENIKSKSRLVSEVEVKNALLSSFADSIVLYESKLEVLSWLVSNIPYIKLHKLSVSMTVLSDYINNYLAEMGDTVRVDIKAFSEKKSKSNVGDFTDLLKGEIDVEIVDGEKNINSRLYSDGEIGKISNAFVRALREMALKSGYGCNILMLDEIFSFIDYNNSQRLADSFVGNNRGTVIITDNSERAGNLIDFSEMWTATKENDLTRMELN